MYAKIASKSIKKADKYLTKLYFRCNVYTRRILCQASKTPTGKAFVCHQLMNMRELASIFIIKGWV